MIGSVNVSSVATAVPSNFLGIQSGRWPVGVAWVNGGAPDPAPNYPYGSFRFHDCYCRWLNIETSAGVYDWTRIDAFMTANAGKNILYCVHGTPVFYAKPAEQSVQGPYNQYGECGMPADLLPLTNFITALVTRYNTVSPYNPSGAKLIKYLEPWNEPRFLQIPGKTSFWWGSAQELVDLSKAVRLAAKAVDPSIVVASPTFENLPSARTYLGTVGTDAVSTGASLSDIFSYHAYYCAASYEEPLAKLGTRVTHPFIGTHPDSFSAWLSIKADLALNLDVIITEWGVAAATTDQNLIAFLGLSARQRYEHVWRTLGTVAALGVKQFYLYSHNTTLAGDLVNDDSGVKAAIADFTAQIIGKTITQATIDTAGHLSLTLSTGQTFSV